MIFLLLAAAMAVEASAESSEMVPDPSSVKPHEWDEVEDGEWQPEMIPHILDVVKIGTVPEITTELDFQRALAAVETLVIMYHKGYCPHCKAMMPVMKSSAKQLDTVYNLRLALVEVQNLPVLGKQANVSGVPDLVVYKRGRAPEKIKKRFQGKAPTAAQLTPVLRSYAVPLAKLKTADDVTNFTAAQDAAGAIVWFAQSKDPSTQAVLARSLLREVSFADESSVKFGRAPAKLAATFSAKPNSLVVFRRGTVHAAMDWPAADNSERDKLQQWISASVVPDVFDFEIFKDKRVPVASYLKGHVKTDPSVMLVTESPTELTDEVMLVAKQLKSTVQVIRSYRELPGLKKMYNVTEDMQLPLVFIKRGSEVTALVDVVTDEHKIDAARLLADVTSHFEGSPQKKEL